MSLTPLGSIGEIAERSKVVERQFNRLALLICFAAVLSQVAPASAQIQLPTVRGPAELSPEQLADEVKGYIDPLRDRLPLELRLAQKAAELSDRQVAELRTAVEVKIDSLSRQTADVLREYHRGPRLRKVVNANGRPIAVPTKLDAELVTEPDVVLNRIVSECLQVRWPELWQQFEAEGEKLDQRLKQAAIFSEVAAIDHVLLLSAVQRQQLYERLAARGSNSGPPAINGAFQIDAPLERLQAALAGWSVGNYSLPEAELATVLKPAQLAAWQELRQPQQQEMLIVQQAVPQPARVVGALPAAPLQLGFGVQARVQQEKAARQRGVAVRAARAPLQPVQRRVVRRGPSASDLQTQLARYVERVVDEIDAACQLTESQRQKLLLAAKLDIEHWREESAAPDEQLAHGEQLVVQQVRVLGAGPPPQISIFHAADSCFQRAYRTRLNDEQRQKLAGAERDRRDFQRRAFVECAVAGFERAAALTSVQCEELSKVFMGVAAGGIGDEADDWRIDCVRRIAELPPGVLASILDETQKGAAAEHQARIGEALRQFQEAKDPRPAVILGGGMF